MKLQITNSLETTIGVSFSDMVATIDFNTNQIMTTGKGLIYLKVWATNAAEIAGKSNVFLIGVDDNFSVQFTEGEINAGITPTMLYTKVKDYLVLTYGYTVNII